MLGARIDILKFMLMHRCMSLITSRYRVPRPSVHLRRSPVANYGTPSRSTSRAARKKVPPPQLHRQCPAASLPRSPTEASQEEKIGRSQLTSFFFLRSQAIRFISPTAVQLIWSNTFLGKNICMYLFLLERTRTVLSRSVSVICAQFAIRESVYKQKSHG
jgi:hypothetical protein